MTGVLYVGSFNINQIRPATSAASCGVTKPRPKGRKITGNAVPCIGLRLIGSTEFLGPQSSQSFTQEFLFILFTLFTLFASHPFSFNLFQSLSISFNLFHSEKKRGPSWAKLGQAAHPALNARDKRVFQRVVAFCT